MHAIKALEALAQAFGREQDMAMVDMVLEDSLIRDLLEDAVDPAQRGGLDGSAMRLKAATPVLASVSPLNTASTPYMSAAGHHPVLHFQQG